MGGTNTVTQEKVSAGSAETEHANPGSSHPGDSVLLNSAAALDWNLLP